MARERQSQQTLRDYEKYLENFGRDAGESRAPLAFHNWYERDYESDYDDGAYD